MAEPDKRQTGDGADSYAQAARQMANAAQQMSRETMKQAASTGTRAASNASAMMVQASVQGGKAAAQIAAGSAAAGPVGAVLSAAWSLRHTLYKILIFLCLFLLILIVLIVSLPSLMLESVLGMNGSQSSPNGMQDSYAALSASVSAVVEQGYDAALQEVEDIIQSGGYDEELSMEALNDLAKSASGFDAAYVLAAYSVSQEQQNTSEADMLAKLNTAIPDLFPVTSAEKKEEQVIPVRYPLYKSVSVTVVVSTQTGSGGRVQYQTGTRTYYTPAGMAETTSKMTVPAYRSVMVTLPVYSGGNIVGTRNAVYYTPDGTTSVVPRSKTVSYVECTIHPFDQTAVLDAFGIDPDEPYGEFGISCGEAVANMAVALKQTLAYAPGNGRVPPLSDVELTAFVSRQNCNATRKEILSTALSLVGKVPYFWGGKSDAGWNDEWNTPKLVTAAGDSTSGTIQPYGLDCSGFTDWVFKTALGVSLYQGSWNQWDNTYAITEEELLPGDLGFMAAPGTVPVNHVLIYAGVGENGEQMWVHCTGGSGVVLNSPDYVTQFRRPLNVDYGDE